MAGAAETNLVDLKVFASRNGDIAGVGSRGFLVDLVTDEDGNGIRRRTSPAVEAAPQGGRQ
ncbi:MAG: hypothetical protein HYY54_03170 [candidate division NC10 bacterium]|nr:hypothetical protein [candidate division NC10 bacterium]MBI3002618.1 hypothetical protein [candidate division NC10 bacterium]MBI4391822.1 hypothetical protein [candidate division NC10 bacterium]